jgi:hypothetical protein
MSDVIQCPSCSKRFKLPAKPPPTFTCTSCQTVMDLSGFAAAPEPEPAVAAVEAPARGGSSRGGSARGGGAPRRGGGGGRSERAQRPSRGAGRRGRDREEDVDEDDGGRRGRGGRKQGGPGLMIAVVLGVLVLAGAVTFFLMSRKSREEEQRAQESGIVPPATPGQPPPTPGTPGTPAAPGPPPPGGGGAVGETPQGEAAKPAGTSGTQYSASKAEMKTYPFTDDTSAEERTQIEEHVRALIAGGSDGRRAETALVRMDLKAVPRLISEFKNIHDRAGGLEKSESLAEAMVVDKTLRKIDGVQERKFKDLTAIHPNSVPLQAMKTIKNWNWWWDTGAFKTREKPWDPRVDEADQGGEGEN